ncbi:MAG: response regulator, partial [Candidatus Competibacterales bacterium]
MTAVTARKLLIVEDDVGLQQQLRWCFDGFDVVLADNREGALGQLRRFEPAVVLLDLGLPPDPTNASEGLKALDDILNLAPATKVVVVTGNQERDHALKAVARGAYDYYQKPVDADVLHLIVERAYHLHQLAREKAALQPTAFQGL